MRLARVLGFEIRVDFSWFILFFLVLWTFTAGVFPASAPGLPRHVYGLMGMGGALLFFVSLLAHELSHAVVARAKGIHVEGITLFLFGGMAHTRTEAATAGDEFQIAVVGPLMSFALAGLFMLAAAAGPGMGASIAVVAVLHYIGLLNLALAVFNLLPGFPLDGGRLFRALVWKVTGDALKATRVASTAGRWLGYGLVAFGLFSAFSGNVIGGMWLLFIGWFLRNAAISSLQQHVLLGLLMNVTARQAMTPDPETVPANTTVRVLMDEYFARRRYSAFPVVAGDVIGVVTAHALRDVPVADWERSTARDVMFALSAAITVRAEDNLVTVLDRLKASPARRVLVMEGNAVIGIITPSDIAFWLERTKQERRS